MLNPETPRNLEIFAVAGKWGMKEQTGRLLARRQLDRNLVGRRSNSSLPALAALRMPWNLKYRRCAANPVRRIARELKVTPRAGQDPVEELDLREKTGRGSIAPGDIASTAGALRNRKLDDEVKATGRPSTMFNSLAVLRRYSTQICEATKRLSQP